MLRLVIVLALLACQADHQTTATTEENHVTVAMKRIEAMTAATTVAELEQVLGTRLRDIGSGIHIFVYQVDGDEFRVGSADGTQVMYVRRVHAGVETVLFGPR